MDEHAEGWVFFEAEFREVIDPRVGHERVGREREDVDLAFAQGGLGAILFVRQVPVLDHAGAADHLLAGIDVRDARRLGHRWQELCSIDHEAMGADEDTLAGGWNGFGGDRRQIYEQRAEDAGEGEKAFHAMRSLMTWPPNWLSCLKRPA